MITNNIENIKTTVSVSEHFFSIIRQAIPPEALKYNRMFRARLTLGLYKYSLTEVFSHAPLVKREIDALIEEMKSLYDKELLNIQLPGEDDDILLENTWVKPVPEIEAKKIHARYHYLLTPRAGRFHLGLFSEEGSLLGLATFSDNDLSHLNHALPYGVEQHDTLVLSRFVTFDNTPLNTPTHFLAQTSKWIRKNYSDVRMVVSYLDPNLGFDGTIYKAYNATLIAEEEKKRYLYYGGRYVSDRYMLEKFGTADFKKLSKMDTAISMSQHKLRPLQVFAWSIARGRTISHDKEPWTVSPLTNLVG